MRRLISLLSLAAVLAAPAAPQTARKKRTATAAPNPETGTFPILKLGVRGNDAFTGDQILAVTGLKQGERVTAADFETARQRLLSTGAFEQAGFEYHFGSEASGPGFLATFEVKEVPQFYAMSFEDFPAPESELRRCLQQKDPLFGPKIPVTQTFLDRYTGFIEQCLAPYNFKEHVKAQLTADYSPDLTILFRPSTPRPNIAEVFFTNTGDILPAALQTAIAGAAIGLGYTERRFRAILDSTIRPIYEAKGYVRVSFPSIATKPSDNVKGLAVTVKVEPGPVYKLMSVRVSGAEDIPPLMKYKPGEVANFDKVKAAQARLDDILRRRGYLHETTQELRTIDDSGHTVSVTLRASPGPQYLTGNLTIVGLDVISEPAIRKIWGLAPGKPFNAAYPDHFLKVVRDEGLFDNLGPTSSATTVHEDTKTVDVTLTFSGPKRKQDWETHPTGADPVQPDLGVPFPPYPP